MSHEPFRIDPFGPIRPYLALSIYLKTKVKWGYTRARACNGPFWALTEARSEVLMRDEGDGSYWALPMSLVGPLFRGACIPVTPL